MKCKKCKRDITDNSIYCNWCGYKQITDHAEIRVPVPRKKGNLYIGQVTVDGERQFISAYTEEEYYDLARKAKTLQIDIKKDPTKTTLGRVIDKFISANDAVLSPSTIKAYKSYRKNRFKSYMDKSLARIDYQRMVNDEAKVVKPKTLANAWRLVTASLNYTEIEIPKVNLPKIAKAERPWLDYQQISILLDKIKGKPCEIAALLALNGLRRSELLHLTSDDIDLERGLIRVRGASVYNDKGQFISKDTNKNATSTRTVHIVIPRLLELLQDRQGIIVTSKPNTTYVQVNRICRDNGLPEVGVHGLRHSYASLGWHLHVDPLTIQREGGWANFATVSKIYTHLTESDAVSDVQSMSDFYTLKND